MKFENGLAGGVCLVRLIRLVRKIAKQQKRGKIMKKLLLRMLNSRKVMCLYIVYSSLFAATFFGATNYVSLSGSHISPFNSWVTAATNIQDAIDAANPGNIVLVLNGFFNLKSEIKVTTNIILKSVGGASTTVIDGGNVVRCLNISGNAFTIDGFTIRNGKSTDPGGGIYGMSAKLEVLNCIVSGNSCDSFGGGIICFMNGIVSNCFISGNSGLVGGGVTFFYGGNIYDSIISNNTALGDMSSAGGGLYFYTSGNAKNCTIIDNFAFDKGGGALVSGNCLIENCIIKGNSAATGGGAFFNDGGLIIKSSISKNLANEDGGGIYCNSESTVRDCFIYDENSAGQNGGGIFCSSAKVMNSVIFGNSAGKGGGVYSLTGTVENCTIAGNSATTAGEGLYCNNGANINSIIYFNSQLIGENIRNAGNTFYNHCCSLPLMPGEKNIDIDPTFLNYSTGNFQLSINSPCIEAGTMMSWMSGAKDIAGNNRISGDFVDIGAYEFPLLRAEATEWKYKSNKKKGTVKGKFISPSLTNYFMDGWQIGMKNGETGELIDGPHELVPNKKMEVWKYKKKKEALIIYKAKKNMLVYKVWVSVPLTNIVFLVQTNAQGVTFSNAEIPSQKEINFLLMPDDSKKSNGWKSYYNQK